MKKKLISSLALLGVLAIVAFAGTGCGTFDADRDPPPPSQHPSAPPAVPPPGY